MRRSFALLAGAVVVAGAATMIGRGSSASPSAEVGGAPLVASGPKVVESTQTAEEVAAFTQLGDDPAVPDPTHRGYPGPVPAIPPANPVSSAPSPAAAPLGAQLQLDKITRAGDHYEAPLADGRRAVLTLDPDLQQLAEKLLDQARAPRGAIVVMAPDGKILALAGRKTEEPKGSTKGTFDWRLATDVWAPAASVFKLVTATALVGAGVDGSDTVCYHGGLRSVTQANLVDDKRDSRCESLAYGVAHSNNAILGKFAFQKLQPPMLETAARELGLMNALPGGELPGNAAALTLPATHDLEFAKTAAGFVNTQLSVAGGALLAATFADRGEQPVPHLIASIDGQPMPAPAMHRVLSADAASQVARMMVGTCEFGSASKSFGKGRDIAVAGKTGTLARTEPFYMEHSWFVGFAPADKPAVIVSVLLGNPENWHLKGHEAAKKLIDRALRGPADADPAERSGKDRTAKRSGKRRKSVVD